MMLRNETISWQAKSLLFIGLTGLGFLTLAGITKVVLYWNGYSGDELDNILLEIEKNPDMTRWLVVIQHLILFVAVPVVFVLLAYGNIKRYWSFSWPGWTSILVFFGLLMIVYPLISVFSLWASMINWPNWLQEMDDTYIDSLHAIFGNDSAWDMVFTLLIVAVLPAIGEELFFRGVVQKELMAISKNHHVAIWITAVIFSLLHFQASGFPAKCLIGVVLGYAYYHTKSLFTPILLHGLNNGTAAIALITTGDQWKEEQKLPQFDWVQLGLVVVFMVMINIYYQHIVLKYEKRNHG